MVIGVQSGHDRRGNALRRLEVYVSPSGRSMRVFLDGVALRSPYDRQQRGEAKP